MLASSLVLVCVLAFSSEADPPVVVVVVGASGNTEYGPIFRTWANRWKVAAEKGKARCEIIGVSEGESQPDLEIVKKTLDAQAKSSNAPLWLILIGHGTYDGKTAKFNLRGPDFRPQDLRAWLSSYERPIAIINCASSSGPFLTELSGKNRVVVTSTKSGFEYNFARFGDFMSAAITDVRADLDKDEQTSLLEAFLLAANNLKEFYDKEGRLSTEHPLIDDSGDALGTPADWFQGVRATKVAKNGAVVDGVIALQWFLVKGSQEEKLSDEARKKRDELEHQLSELRNRKSELAADEYYQLLEPILVELARLYN